MFLFDALIRNLRNRAVIDYAFVVTDLLADEFDRNGS